MHTSKTFSLRVVAVLTTLVQAGVATPTTAQVRPPQRPVTTDSTVTRIMGAARRGNFPEASAIDVLRNPAAYSEATRTALADSATALAISSPREEWSAVYAIAASGLDDPHLGGQADPSALDRLIRIHREARNGDTRGAAMHQLLAQPDVGRALPYVQGVIVSGRSDDALVATIELSGLAFRSGRSSSPAGIDAATLLRRIYDADSLKSSTAASYLCQIAGGQKWPSRPMCRGRA